MLKKVGRKVWFFVFWSQENIEDEGEMCTEESEDLQLNIDGEKMTVEESGGFQSNEVCLI